MSRRRTTCSIAMIARALKAGKQVGVPVAVTWDAAAERLTVFPCAPITASAGADDPIADAIAKFAL